MLKIWFIIFSAVLSMIFVFSRENTLACYRRSKHKIKFIIWRIVIWILLLLIIFSVLMFNIVIAIII